jgi:type I restriction enzyme S subunit
LYRLVTGDVLFNRTNSPELVGKTAVFHGEREAIYAGYLIRVRCSSRVLPDYLGYCLNSPAGRDYCWQVKTDAVSQSNINATKLAAFTFDLPPLDEQKEIIRRVETLFAFANGIDAHLTEARAQVERLTPAVLAKAFRGELVPRDPSDESASALLERLRARQAIEAVQPKREKQPRTRAMKPVSKDSVRDVILSLQKDNFGFLELREAVGGDYDALTEAVFHLLAEKKPVLKQVFNTRTKIMQFQKLKV